MRAAVQLSLYLLRVGVWGQLLAAALHQQEQAVVFGVRHFELAGAQLAHLLHGGIRLHLQGLGCAAAVQLLQSNPQVVLRDSQRRRSVFREQNIRSLKTQMFLIAVKHRKSSLPCFQS